MINSNKAQLYLSAIPLVFALIIGMIILFFLRFLPSKLPLFYSLSWGDNQLATHQQFLIIPVSITLISVVNFILSQQLHSSQVFFKKALMLCSLVSTLILTVTFIKIIFIFI